MIRVGPARALAGLMLAAALLAGCATVERYDASADIRAFLIAVRDGDRAGFDAHVDRPALKRNLRARLLAAQARRSGPDSAGAALALLAGPLVDVAVDALVQPEVFRAAAALAGYGAETRIPGALAIGQGVRPLDSQRVCAEIDRRCAFIFKREDGVWRLIDYAGDLGLLGRTDRPGR